LTKCVVCDTIHGNVTATFCSGRVRLKCLIILKNKEMRTKILFIAILLIGFFGSCKKMDTNPFNEPNFVEDQPVALKDVNDRVYLDASDLQSAKSPMTFQDENTNEYYDNWGQRVVEKYYVNTTYYTMKSRDYWGWSLNVEYASTYKLKYQIRSDVYSAVEEALKNTHHIYCYKQKVQGQFDRFGYGVEITGIVK
jgi:hypothetical protein